MLSAIILVSTFAAPPEDGLSQAFSAGEIYYETVDVRVTSQPPGKDSPQTSLHYTIELDTLTDVVESSEEALLDSKVFQLFVETSVGKKLTAHYDTSERRVIGSVDASTFDTDELVDLWAPFRTVSIRRKAMVDGSLKIDQIIGLPLEAEESPVAAAFKQSVSSILSCTLPAGPIESWTDETPWPTTNGDIPVLRLYSYAGQTESGQDRIDISAAAVGKDGTTRLENPPLVARGSLYFDRQRKRIVTLDLIVEMTGKQKTRTNIAWRLVPGSYFRDALGVSDTAKSSDNDSR